MKIRINKAHYPVTVLGPGRRIGLWFQGCRIRCPACVSQDTWAEDPGRETTVAKILSWCRKVATAGVDGITISGGEPFDQPRALAALLDALQCWRQQSRLDFDILCYSGYPLARLQERHAALLGRLDALIPEPYVDNLPLTHRWRGSANQPLIPLSERGRLVYGPHIDAPADSEGKRLQAQLDNGRLWAIGIPARGDMARLAEQCEHAGIRFAGTSWGRA